MGTELQVEQQTVRLVAVDMDIGQVIHIHHTMTPILQEVIVLMEIIIVLKDELKNPNGQNQVLQFIILHRK